jgi:hypothetical protein
LQQWTSVYGNCFQDNEDFEVNIFDPSPLCLGYLIFSGSPRNIFTTILGAVLVVFPLLHTKNRSLPWKMVVEAYLGTNKDTPEDDQAVVTTGVI